MKVNNRIEGKPVLLRLESAVGGLAVDNPNARDLRQLGVEHLVLIFDPSDDSILQQVSVSLILLRVVQLYIS